MTCINVDVFGVDYVKYYKLTLSPPPYTPVQLLTAGPWRIQLMVE